MFEECVNICVSRWYMTVVVCSDVLIAYISRGLLSSLMEPREVMTVISNENRRTRHRVIINTYAVIDGKFPLRFLACCILGALLLVLVFSAEYVSWSLLRGQGDLSLELSAQELLSWIEAVRSGQARGQ